MMSRNLDHCFIPCCGPVYSASANTAV